MTECWEFRADVCHYDPATHRVRVTFPPPRRTVAELPVRGPRPALGDVLTGYVEIEDDGTGDAVCTFAPFYPATPSGIADPR
jgi:hypothetical protein